MNPKTQEIRCGSKLLACRYNFSHNITCGDFHMEVPYLVCTLFLFSMHNALPCLVLLLVEILFTHTFIHVYVYVCVCIYTLASNVSFPFTLSPSSSLSFLFLKLEGEKERESESCESLKFIKLYIKVGVLCCRVLSLVNKHGG